MVRLRALVSANDAAALWDLRCLVRERLVSYVWEHQQNALPRVRAELDAERSRPIPVAHRTEASPDSRVFSGGDDADERGAAFLGPDGPDGSIGRDGSDRSTGRDGLDGSTGVDGSARSDGSPRSADRPPGAT
jgi:hypothetical protein